MRRLCAIFVGFLLPCICFGVDVHDSPGLTGATKNENAIYKFLKSQLPDDVFIELGWNNAATAREDLQFPRIKDVADFFVAVEA